MKTKLHYGGWGYVGMIIIVTDYCCKRLEAYRYTYFIAHTHAHTHACTHTHTHYTHTLTHTHTYIHTHYTSHTNTYTHTHTHTTDTRIISYPRITLSVCLGIVWKPSELLNLWLPNLFSSMFEAMPFSVMADGLLEQRNE